MIPPSFLSSASGGLGLSAHRGGVGGPNAGWRATPAPEVREIFTVHDIVLSMFYTKEIIDTIALKCFIMVFLGLLALQKGL